MAMTGSEPAHLQAPTEPIYENPWGIFSIGAVGFLLLCTYQVFATDANSYARQYTTSEWIVIGLLITALPAALIVARKLRVMASRRHVYEVAMAAYSVALDRWNKLYWCSKDGIDFVLDEGAYSEVYLQGPKPTSPRREGGRPWDEESWKTGRTLEGGPRANP